MGTFGKVSADCERVLLILHQHLIIIGQPLLINPLVCLTFLLLEIGHFTSWNRVLIGEKVTIKVCLDVIQHTNT